jgi:hypothetical protein
MIRAIPPGIMYALFAAALILATSPAWRPWLFGVAPTLDDLLTLRCFGL